MEEGVERKDGMEGGRDGKEEGMEGMEGRKVWEGERNGKEKGMERKGWG